jgi:hypothetical protein
MAQPITVTIPHRLGKAEARARIEAGFGQLENQIAGASLASFNKAWSGDKLSFSANALGQQIAGRIDVDEREVRLEIDLPAFLAGMADAIAGKLKRQGALLLEDKSRKK